MVVGVGGVPVVGLLGICSINGLTRVNINHTRTYKYLITKARRAGLLLRLQTTGWVI